MKTARNNYALIDSQQMKKAAVCDFSHPLSPAHLLILNFTNGLGVWDATSVSRTGVGFRIYRHSNLETQAQSLVQLEVGQVDTL